MKKTFIVILPTLFITASVGNVCSEELAKEGSGIATAHFVAGRYNDAIEWAYISIYRKPTWRIGHVVLISSL